MTWIGVPYAEDAYDFTVEKSGLATIHNIDLLGVGTWWASTGECTFTEQDLQNFLASLDDPAVKDPRMIIGHTGLGPVTMADQMEGFVGEQPCIGKFVNCRLSASGQTVIGDLTGVPVWLAKILPTAYPTRSVEAYWDVTTVTQKHHGMVIPRIAMLGENLPGVATLHDLEVLMSAAGPFGDTQTISVGTRVAASQLEARMPAPVAASVGYEDVRRAFYEQVAVGDRYWWWIRTIFMDPAKIIVDDDDDNGVWAIDYSIANDEVTFGEPVRIFTQYVEKDSGKVAASAAVMTGLSGRMPAASFSTSDDSRPDQRPAQAQNQETTMARTALEIAALEKLGLTAEASDEEFTEALNALPAPEVETAPVAASSAPAKPTAPVEAAPVVNSDAVVVDKASFEAMQAQLAALAKTNEESTKSANLSVVEQAKKDKKILPSRVEHFNALMEKDPEGTKQFLASLQPNSVGPAAELGADASGEQAEFAGGEAYPSSWLSDSERERAAAFNAGTPAKPDVIVQEVS